jgi:hypothetical protein
METIPYRNTKVVIKTIPKGTLLFRRLKKNQENDIRGILTEEGKRCQTSNFNVFFYPNPFASTFRATGLNVWIYDKYVYVYILNKDIKVISLVKPSKYSRSDRTRKRLFIKQCSTVKNGCLPKQRNTFDACLIKNILKKYPEIVGTMAVSKTDSLAIQKSLEKPEFSNIKKFFKNAQDAAETIGVPELAISPFVSQPQKDILAEDVDPPETNYRLLTKLNFRDRKEIVQFMNTKTKYNPDTFFYQYKE